VYGTILLVRKQLQYFFLVVSWKSRQKRKGAKEMSDRTRCLTVVLDQDYRICDDAQAIINAISMVKGVVSVEANVKDSNDYLAYESARHEIEQKLWEALKRNKP
jgi:copper chaperone CopZ